MTIREIEQVILRATGKPAALSIGTWRDGGDDSDGHTPITGENHGRSVRVVTHDGRHVAIFRITEDEYRANGNDLVVIARGSKCQLV